MPQIAWHLRHIRGLVYCGLAVAILAVALVSGLDAPDAARAWVGARQLFGLWALGLLLASMLVGPLTFVLPWLPLKAHLMLGRRAVGVSSFLMALMHAACYLGPIAYSGAWNTLLESGNPWIVGLVFGGAGFVLLGLLSLTSRRAAIRSLGPQRWKRLHKLVYVALPAVLIHAIFVGADFGFSKSQAGEVDAGCLVAMSLLSAAWLAFGLMRKYRIRWMPAVFCRRQRSRSAPEALSARTYDNQVS